MSSAFGVSVLSLLTPALLFLALAVFLLRKGLRPRRMGDTPHCRKCDYNLTGLSSERCPECGANLVAGSIVYGEPHQKAGRVLLGVLSLVITGALLVASSYRINWYQLRPTGWLIGDLASTNASDARRAWTELDRRYLAGRLSVGQNSRLIDVALQEQARATPGPLLSNLVDHLGRACLAGQMSASQQQTFITQAISATLQARPTTILGRRAPVRVSHADRAPSRNPWLSYELSSFSVDDQKPNNMSSMTGFASGCGGHGSFSTGVHIQTVGRHKLKAVARVKLWNGPYGNQAGSELLGSTDIPLTAETEVLADQPADYIKHTSGPATDARIRASLEPKDLRLKLMPQTNFELTVGIRSPPVGVAMEVLICVDGREYKIGTINAVAGRSTDWHVEQEWRAPGDEKPASFESCDVILRSSDNVAGDTVDLFEIWNGEIVYQNVPVKLETPTTQPTQPAASKGPTLPGPTAHAPAEATP